MARIGFNAILSLVVAHRLGAEGLGKYAVLTAYVQIFQVITMMGVPRLVIREMARQPNERRSWFQRTVVNQMTGAGGSAIILILVANLLGHPADTTRALEIVALSLFPFAISSALESTFQAREQMGFIALAQIGARGVQISTSVLALLTGYGIVALAWMVVIGQCLVAAIEIGLARWMGLWRDFRVDLNKAVILFRQSSDFFLLSLFVVVFSRLDVLILSQIVGEKATGLYNAAYLIVQVVNFLSAGYSNAIYPVLSRLFMEAQSRFETLLRKSLLFGTTITLLIAILLATAAELVIRLVYRGEEYTTSVLLLRIVVPFVIIFLWNALLSTGLMAGNLQRRSVIISGSKLGAGLIYYLTLTTLLGATGTALATVLAGFTGAVLNYYFLNKEVCSLDLTTLVAKPLTVGAILIVVLWMARGLAWPGLIVGGIFFYVSLLMVFRIFSREDLRLFWRVVWPLLGRILGDSRSDL